MYTYIYTHVCIYIYIYIYILTHYVCVYIYIYTHIQQAYSRSPQAPLPTLWMICFEMWLKEKRPFWTSGYDWWVLREFATRMPMIYACKSAEQGAPSTGAALDVELRAAEPAQLLRPLSRRSKGSPRTSAKGWNLTPIGCSTVYSMIGIVIVWCSVGIVVVWFRIV